MPLNQLSLAYLFALVQSISQTFNNFEMLIEKLCWSGCFDFADSLFFVIIVLGLGETWLM